MKTAISLESSLLEQVEQVAQEMNISRSRLFVLAVEAFIQNHQNQKLLAAINAAYDDAPDPSEQEMRRRMKYQQRQLVEGQW